MIRRMTPGESSDAVCGEASPATGSGNAGGLCRRSSEIAVTSGSRRSAEIGASPHRGTLAQSVRPQWARHAHAFPRFSRAAAAACEAEAPQTGEQAFRLMTERQQICLGDVVRMLPNGFPRPQVVDEAKRLTVGAAHAGPPDRHRGSAAANTSRSARRMSVRPPSRTAGKAPVRTRSKSFVLPIPSKRAASVIGRARASVDF